MSYIIRKDHTLKQSWYHGWTTSYEISEGSFDHAHIVKIFVDKVIGKEKCIYMIWWPSSF